MIQIVFHLIICVLLVGVVLLQQGRSDMGASLGGGGNTFFGAAGADNLLVKITTGLAIVFMVSSIFLARAANEIRAGTGSLGQQQSEEPAKPTSAPSGGESAPPPPASDVPAPSDPAQAPAAPAGPQE